jgi:hypothetical protein
MSPRLTQVVARAALIAALQAAHRSWAQQRGRIGVDEVVEEVETYDTNVPSLAERS